jgi:transposase
MDLYGASRDDLIQLILQQHGRIAELEQQLARQQTEIATLRASVRQVTQQLGEALATTRLPTDPPPASPPPRPTRMPGLKPASARPPRPTKPRQRRPHGFARRRMDPTDRQVHAVAACPDCGTPLAGGTVIHTREVLEVPVTPISVIEHVYLERRCPCCQRTHRPPVELSGVVLGQGRLGVRLVSLLATLREVGRLPIRVIQELLAALWGLELSVGGIVGALGQVTRRAGPLVAEILARIRGSPVVHADESGWREDGVNGYIWTFSTQTERYFLRRSREKEVVDAVLGAGFAGVLVSDFYAAYDHYPGVKQRCWSHLLADIKEVGQQYPKDARLQGWVKAVRAIWARASGACPLPAYRAAQQRAYEQELLALCQPYLADETAPQAVLCRRIEKYLSELFVFVGNPAVPATNNAAERSLRPTVIARKISGGTRAPAGTQTKMTLATIFGTWRVRGLNPFAECLRLLAAPTAPA